MRDWEHFRAEISWFVQPGDSVAVGATRPWDRGPVDGLPVLSALLGAASVTPVSVGADSYELLAWGPADTRRGWLCRPPDGVDSGLDSGPPGGVDGSPPGGVDGGPVPEVHRRFWKVCGGIVERFCEPTTWWMNQNQVLTAEATHEQIGEWLAAYAWIWENENLPVPIDPGDYYVVTVEANGNLTLAHRADGRLLLFAPDHGFDRVTPLAGCPPYSLLTIDDVPDLTTWIEVCAEGWQLR